MRNPTETNLAMSGWWRIPPPQEDYRAIPFLRVVGSLREWTSEAITDRELCRALRKAAAEVDRGY
jgi:hypothetical protein